MKKGKIIALVSVIIVIMLLLIVFVTYSNNKEIKTIKSDKELYQFYDSKSYGEMTILEQILTLPFSVLFQRLYYGTITTQWNDIQTVDGGMIYEDATTKDSPTNAGSTTKDYSKTNIQVEGVDEADIIKTDGDYIYSISNKNVVITNVKDPTKIEIETKLSENSVPCDLLLYKDKLVVISSDSNNSSTNYYWSRSIGSTEVTIYNTKDKANPKLEKRFKLNEGYNTSRVIDGNLYIFSSGYLKKDNSVTTNKVEREYEEGYETKEIKLSNIKYIKDNKSNKQTIIAEVDLNNIKNDIKVNSYLIDMDNAYVSKNNIYLLNEQYDSESIKISSLFTLWGVFGLFRAIDEDYSYNDNTYIFKFNIDKNKGVVYKNNTKIDGEIINQYSLDEKDNNLRIALYTEYGSRIAVLDENLKLLGETSKVAKGEKMYSSRFMGDRAYLVTYQNTDPLFTIDLSDPKNPKVLGKLEIPGYSTYLHPYDENHIIGIGMNTEERVTKDYNGRVISERAVVTGMKMALFDVSDINNPKEIDSTPIGDSRTVSAILSNPKALLFSKEKNLLAIPVNNYKEDFSVKEYEDYSSEIKEFTRNNNYISEGYLVYNIDLKGFKLKGTITHEQELSNYRYYTVSHLLRGLYIEDDLFTVSENAIKVNKLDDLTEISKIDIKGEKENEKR